MAEPAARWDGPDVLLHVRGKPSARRDALLAVEGDSLKVAVAAAAEKGRATERMLRLLASEFGVARASVSLVSGEFSPIKRVRIKGPRKLPEMLQSLLGVHRET